MPRLKLLQAVVTGLLLALLVPAAPAKQSDTSSLPVISRISPASHHISLDQAIANLLSYYHYRQNQLDDNQSSAIFDAYIDALDFNRLYFLAQDIAQFSKYRDVLDDYLRAGNLNPAYDIFNLYLERLAARTARLNVQLQRSVSFAVDESLTLDREQQDWALSKVELDEIWRKRIKNELLLLVLAGKDLAEAREVLLRRYEGRLRRTTQYKSEDVFQIYMNAVATSYDPHTAYFSPRTSENFNIQMRLSLEGIGTVLRMEEEQINVVELITGGPAALSGQLHPDDKIVGVGQGDDGAIIDVVGWRLDDVVDLIRGRRGSVVKLEILPASGGAAATRQVIRLVRDTIKLEKQAAKGEVKTLAALDGATFKIGTIVIPTFYSDFAAAQRGDANYRSTTRDVRSILQDLKQQQVDGVVIDLRQNGGGSLQEAVALTGLFIDEGPVVQVRNARGSVDVERDPDPNQVYDGPLVLLVNRFSASASEIFAGAIQDYGRGIVLGEPTFGKGTVQTLVDLNRFVRSNDDNRLGQLKLTIAKFYRITGSSTQNRGVIPDIQFPSAFDSQEVGESAQDFALPWDEISAIRFQRFPYPKDLLLKLQKRHEKRIRNDSLFQVLLDDIQTIRQARDETTVSLLESRRKAERQADEIRALKRINKQRVALGLPPLQQGENADEVEEIDPILNESTRILVDLIALLRGDVNSHTIVMNQKLISPMTDNQ